MVDSFAFAARDWNEDRFADSKLLARTPFTIGSAANLAAFCVHQGVDPRAWLDYVTGFSKINNRDRFERDAWVGATQFEHTYRSSATAVRQRIAYLYPTGAPSATEQARYLAQFEALLTVATAQGMHVVAIKPPAPALYRSMLAGETVFDARLTATLARHGATLHDLSATQDKPTLYLDTDHLNRAGVTALYNQDLKAILLDGRSE